MGCSCSWPAPSRAQRHAAEQGVGVRDGVERVLLELDLGDVAALLDAGLELAARSCCYKYFNLDR